MENGKQIGILISQIRFASISNLENFHIEILCQIAKKKKQIKQTRKNIKHFWMTKSTGDIKFLIFICHHIISSFIVFYQSNIISFNTNLVLIFWFNDSI